MFPDEPTEEERQQELPQDNGTPFQPAAPAPDDVTSDPEASATQDAQLPDDHPTTDTGIQPEEVYDEGVSGAAEATDDSSKNAVTDYTPPADTSGDEPPDGLPG